MSTDHRRVVAGVDGFGGGWVVAIVTWTDKPGESNRVDGRIQVVDHVSNVMEVTGDCAVIGVDMPMALPESGVRPSDHELRAWLGKASRSLFYTPTRAAMTAHNHADAVTRNKAAGGKGPSAQGWGLAAKIREVRSTLGPDPDPRFVEVHPESSFLMLHNEVHLASKKSAQGIGQRMELLQEWGVDPVRLLGSCGAGPRADDVLDALAAAWTAQRVAAEQARWFGPRRPDDQGWCAAVAV